MNKKLRQRARKLVLQALYQWQFTGDPVAVVLAQFYEANAKVKIDRDYFAEVFRGVVDNSVELDEKIKPFLDRDLKELNSVELAVLRLAVYELIYRLDIPYKVVINEALEIAKEFGSIEGFKYVNGVLDKIAREIRVSEIGVKINEKS